MNNAIILLVCLALGFYGLLNAVYAFRCPARFLKAKWTAKRNIGLEDVQFVGLIYILLAGFCLWCAYVTIREMISGGVS
jgi:hypothetical protein